MLTRLFKSGNSLAVRIPKELAFIDAAQDVEIERVGNTLIIKPQQQKTIGDLSSLLSGFPEGFMEEGREADEEQERDWPAHLASPGHESGRI